MIEINGIDQLNEFIINNNKNNNILLLYFGSESCTPCKKLKKRLINESYEMSKLVIAYIDVNDPINEEITYNYDIRILPTQIFIELNGENIKINNSIIGYDWIKLNIEYNKIAHNILL